MKYIIVGAVAGGASTAARLRRNDEHAEIVLFEKGEYISYANCGLPYYIGEVIKKRDALFVQTAAAFNKRFNIDVRVKSEVVSIDRVNKTVTVFDHNTQTEYKESYDKLVLSPGADPVRPPLPGIDMDGIFTLRNVTDTDFIKTYVDERKSGKAVVVGGGFIGLEMAENLHQLGLDVSIIEMGNQILAPIDFPMAAIVQQHIRAKGVDLRLNTSVTAFQNKLGHINVLLSNGEEILADVVILSIGVRPDTRLANLAGIQTGPARGILVNEYLQTSDPSIYAVGDAIEFVSPITKKSTNTFLAGPANKQGRICANNLAFGNTEKYNGAINTAIVKVFDMTVATAGTASKILLAEKIQHIVSTTHSGSHASYYPGAQQMHIQIAFTPDTGRLLSAQVVGFEGVDKRMEMLSSVIKRNGTIDELMEMEHAYAPPFSSAKDPINIAGFVAGNILNQKMVPFYCNEVDQIGKNAVLIDVRTKNENNAGTIPGAINIPVDELRSNLDSLPKQKEIFVFCEVGQRGYLAQRILNQNGFERVKNLSGGYATWKNCEAELPVKKIKVEMETVR
ncbi:MAG: FAD-dependent oxidoreductase [Bacteroidetes bacterium]|nr:FAD-dependent oxidoreductase [Bacteroidota bacterium]